MCVCVEPVAWLAEACTKGILKDFEEVVLIRALSNVLDEIVNSEHIHDLGEILLVLGLPLPFPHEIIPTQDP